MGVWLRSSTYTNLKRARARHVWTWARKYNEAARAEFKRHKKVKVSAASDHVTITWFWIHAVRDRLRKDDSYETFIARHPELGSFSFIFDYYTAEELYTPEYHDNFIPPPSKRQLRQKTMTKTSGKGNKRRR